MDSRPAISTIGRHLRLGPGKRASQDESSREQLDLWRVRGDEIVQGARGVTLAALLATEVIDTIIVSTAHQALRRPGVRALIALDEAQMESLAGAWVIDGTTLDAADALDRQLLRLVIALYSEPR